MLNAKSTAFVRDATACIHRFGNSNQTSYFSFA